MFDSHIPFNILLIVINKRKKIQNEVCTIFLGCYRTASPHVLLLIADSNYIGIVYSRPFRTHFGAARLVKSHCDVDFKIT